MKFNLFLMILLVSGLLACAAYSCCADDKKTIMFSGYEWNVKQSKIEPMGPGPNAWESKNVWLDSKGSLHLKISHDAAAGKWKCAEVATVKRFGFGTYEFMVAGSIDKFDINTVLGLFNYPTPDVGEDGTNEIDIEFAHWGNATYPPGNFTVWPPVKGQKNGSQTFDFSLNKSQESLHRFVWTKKSVSFESYTGSRGDPKSKILAWKYGPDDFEKRIASNPEPILMNLWLFRGHAPTDNKEVEIVIKKFKFTPEQ